MAGSVKFDGVYTLCRKLGQGGTSTVFLAEVDLDAFDYTTLFAYTQVQGKTHTQRRKRAQKLAASLRGEQLDPQTMRTILRAQGIPVPGERAAIKVAGVRADRRRFAGEWQNLLCLSHPGVIEVYGGGEFSGQAYYVMEYLATMIPLEEILRSFTLREKVRVLVQAGRGLQYLHDYGLVHRDIKPGNIATCRADNGGYFTKIMDLGLAKNVEENLGLTQDNVILGSPAYMSPEQAASSRDVDHRADVYSLGATMYHLLTGRRPYFERRGPYDVIIAVTSKVPPASPRELVPELPSALLGIMQTAMEHDRGARYAAVEEMVEDLLAYLDDEADTYLDAVEWATLPAGSSGVALGRGRFNFEEILRKHRPEAFIPPPAEPVRGELDRYNLLVMNRKHAQHAVFSRSARELGVEYRRALSLRRAEEVLATERIDVAVFEFSRGLPRLADLCRQARVRKVPFILHGDNLQREDILAAARLGASAVMINPIAEAMFREKVLALLASLARPAPRADGSGTESRVEAGLTPPAKARQVAKKARDLLALPHAASRVISLCSDPAASADDLAAPIKSDSAIAAMVLRRANSVAFGGRGRIASIRDAVVRIGRRETRQLAVTMAVYKLFDKREKSFGFNRYMYWIHALGAGIAARILAGKLPKLDPEQAFLAGLLHDIGKLVFDDHLNPEYRELIQRATTEGLRVCQVEQEVFVMDHAFMGARVGEQWNLPVAITEAIETHHRPPPAGDEDLPPRLGLGRIACMANSMIKAMGAGHSGDFYVDDFHDREWRLALRQLEAIPNHCEMVRRELSDYADMLGIDTARSGIGRKLRKQERGVAIVPDGLGILLHFFFAARGYRTRFIGWDEAEKCEEDLACDGRRMPESLAELCGRSDAFWNRRVFLLDDDRQRRVASTVHVISPARDFFRLEQKIVELNPAE